MTAKIGRNQKCPCGSDKKYKKCCGLGVEKQMLEKKRNQPSKHRKEIHILDLFSNESEVLLERIYGKSSVKKSINQLYGRAEGLNIYYFTDNNGLLQFVVEEEEDAYFYYGNSRRYISSFAINNLGQVLFSPQYPPTAALWLFQSIINGEDLSWHPYPKFYWEDMRKVFYSLYKKDEDSVQFSAVYWLVETKKDSGIVGYAECKAKYDRSATVQRLSLWESVDTYPFISTKNTNNLIGSLSPPKEESFFSLQLEDKLSDNICFAFSDGQMIPLSKLVYHPYALLVPKESFTPVEQRLNLPSGFTHFLNNENEIDLFSQTNYYFTERTSENEVLDDLFCKANQKVFDLYLINREQYKMTAELKKALPVKSISWSHESAEQKWNCKVVNSNLELTACASIDEKTNKIINNSLLYNEDGAELIINSLPILTKCVNDLLGKYENRTDFKYKYHSPSVLQKEFIILTKTHVGELLSDLQRLLANNFSQTLHLPERKKVTSEQVHPELYFSFKNSEQLDVGFHIEGDNYSLKALHLPFYFYNWLEGLSAGWAAYKRMDSKYLTVSRKGRERQNDLKLLRHCGFFSFLASEVLQERIKRSQDNNCKSVKQWVSEVLCKANLLVATIFNGRTSETEDLTKYTLRDFLSKKLINGLKSWLSEVVVEDVYNNYLMFSAKGELLEVDLRDHIDQLLLLLCKAYIQSLGDSAFLKSRKKDIVFKIDESVSFTINDFESPKAVQMQKQIRLPNLRNLVVDALPSHANIYFDGKLLETLQDKDIEVSFQMEDQESLDWFEMDPRVFFKGELVSNAEAKDLLGKSIVFYKGSYYRVRQSAIPSLKWLDYFWERIQNPSSGSKGSGRELESQPQAKSEILNMLALRQAGLPVIGGERWQKICHQFDELGSENISERLKRQEWVGQLNVPLKEYQKQGVQWLLDHYGIELGAILADDMGLGKTVQLLSFLEVLRMRNELGLSLIVVPTSLMYGWQIEIQKFVPNLNYCFFDPKEKDNYNQEWQSCKADTLVITTYGLLNEHKEFFCGQKWNVAVFDEGQYLKNLKSLRTKAARELLAKCKFILTGTPMENHYGEFYSLIDLVVPGALGDYSDFMKVYEFKKTQGAIKALKQQDVEFLRLKTQSLVLRRTKASILKELPDKVETEVRLPFEHKQKKIYRDTAMAWNKKVLASIEQKGEAKSQLEMLTALLRLRQICSSPGLVPGVEYKKTPPKMELLIEKVTELVEKNESVLIFTNFVKTLEIVERELEKQGVSCLKLTGETNRQTRVKILEEFDNSADKKVLLMTLKVGGVGLNLTKASYVFHLEPWWNPAVEDQATDRTHRLGQTQRVNVYRYIMESSIEEKIQVLKGIKKQAFDLLFSESIDTDFDKAHFNKKQLSKKDFEALLKM